MGSFGLATPTYIPLIFMQIRDETQGFVRIESTIKNHSLVRMVRTSLARKIHNNPEVIPLLPISLPNRKKKKKKNVTRQNRRLLSNLVFNENSDIRGHLLSSLLAVDICPGLGQRERRMKERMKE